MSGGGSNAVHIDEGVIDTVSQGNAVEGAVFFIHQGKEDARKEGIQDSPGAFVNMAEREEKHGKDNDGNVVHTGLFEPEGKVVPEIELFKVAGTKAGKNHDDNGQGASGGLHR
jgi:hypothetical protein